MESWGDWGFSSGNDRPGEGTAEPEWGAWGMWPRGPQGLALSDPGSDTFPLSCPAVAVALSAAVGRLQAASRRLCTELENERELESRIRAELRANE